MPQAAALGQRTATMEPVDERTAPAFVRHLGSRVRALRRQRGLTLQQLADDAGLSRRALNAIELGTANPSLITVDKVARALGTDFARLATTPADAALSTVPRAEATTVWSTPAGSRALLHVSARERGGPELWSWLLRPGERYEAQPDAPRSEELFLVTAGSLTVHAAGAPSAVLHAGDAARLASDRAYAYANESASDTAFVRVVRVSTA